RRLGAAGIRACFFIQFGYPGETFDDIMATVKMVRETLPDDIGVSGSYPLPGTRVHGMVKPQPGDKANLPDRNGLPTMVPGTYASPFYRHLHRLVHDDLVVRQRLARQREEVGPTDDLPAAIDHLNAGWLELGRLEAMYRNVAPTKLALPILGQAAPDLSKEWN